MASKPSPTLSAARSKAALARHRGSNDPATLEADIKLRAVSLEEHIKRVVDGFPPLTADQRNRLALLLRGGDAA